MIEQIYPYTQMMAQMASQSLIRVNGIDGAKAYKIGANMTVALFDSNEDVFYVKSTDMSGFSNIRVFKFEEMLPTEKNETSNYVSREEMQEYVKHIIQEQQATDKSTAITVC